MATDTRSNQCNDCNYDRYCCCVAKQSYAARTCRGRARIGSLNASDWLEVPHNGFLRSVLFDEKRGTPVKLGPTPASDVELRLSWIQMPFSCIGRDSPLGDGDTFTILILRNGDGRSRSTQTTRTHSRAGQYQIRLPSLLQMAKRVRRRYQFIVAD